tara:strand:+ start:436 stop:633 length:198 start_codon:yes stop_codon:yes gene_type:complete
MGVMGQKVRSVKLVVDGMDELDVRLDGLESKFDDMLTLIAALSAEIVALKTKAKAPAKKASTKKK